jgi:hypothetical protein
MWEIAGMLTLPANETLPEREVWHPMFQYKDEVQAKAIFNMLIIGEDLPKNAGVEEYEDFKVYELPPPAPRRRARAESPSETPEQPPKRRRSGPRDGESPEAYRKRRKAAKARREAKAEVTQPTKKKARR